MEIAEDRCTFDQLAELKIHSTRFKDVVSPLTAGALSRYIPAAISCDGDFYFFQCHKSDKGWTGRFKRSSNEVSIDENGEFKVVEKCLYDTGRTDKSLAWVMASILILLLENKVIKL